MLTVADPNGGVQRHLLPGSLLWRKDSYVGVVDHYGILLQAFPPVVAHIDKSIEGYLQPRVEAYEQFAAGRQVMGEPVAEAIPLEVMWPRVNEIARVKRPFGLMAFGDTWNCESFARHVREGSAGHSRGDGWSGRADRHRYEGMIDRDVRGPPSFTVSRSAGGPLRGAVDVFVHDVRAPAASVLQGLAVLRFLGEDRRTRVPGGVVRRDPVPVNLGRGKRELVRGADVDLAEYR